VRRAWLGAVAAVALVGVAGCGDDEEQQPAASSAAKPAAAPAGEAKDALTVDIAAFKYMPKDAVVAKGATVSFVNRDTAPHTATAEDGSFDTKRLNKSQKGDVTLDKAGTFTYICEYHRFMEAKITVK